MDSGLGPHKTLGGGRSLCLEIAPCFFSERVSSVEWDLQIEDECCFIRPFFTFINLVLSVVRWKPPCFMATKNCVQNLSALDFPLNYSSEYSNQIVKQTTDGLYTYNLYHTQQKTVQTTFGSIINLIFPPIGWFKDNLAVETNLMAKKYGVLVMIFPIRTHPLKNEITCWIINNHNLNYGSLPVP